MKKNSTATVNERKQSGVSSNILLNDSILTPYCEATNAYQNNLYRSNFQLNGCDTESEYMPNDPHDDVSQREIS